MHHVKEVKLLVDNLNKHRHAYYNLNGTGNLRCGV